ncbi:hypothetical protein MANES_02G216560v8 [Manihot esculenta]|uniref:Uncharacterized protein n=1 Tax=Manihot esculenta TaxID=3983 RepID=A0ACB7I8V3_MANES|nr:hypothetical protein MANES_02G216560v8 [Manihot esculenta]
MHSGSTSPASFLGTLATSELLGTPLACLSSWTLLPPPHITLMLSSSVAHASNSSSQPYNSSCLTWQNSASPASQTHLFIQTSLSAKLNALPSLQRVCSFLKLAYFHLQGSNMSTRVQQARTNSLPAGTCASSLS